MALYQYYLAVIPKQGIEKIHEFIPIEIKVSTETGYFESDAKIYWTQVMTGADEIVSKLDLIIVRANWSNNKTSFNWKTYTDKVDNVAVIYLDEGSMTIKEFYFRADLRENPLTFLKNMIELGRLNEWMFMDRNGKLMNPNFEEIKLSIMNSTAFKFLSDPIKFIEDFAKNGTI